MSSLLLVATTAPGAEQIAGMATLVVLPERGAITARTTSSHPA